MAGTIDRESVQALVSRRAWDEGVHVAAYATRELRPVEVTLLVRYRDELSGRVLELGCGAGRLTGYLAELAEEAVGLDVSPAMVDYCRQRYPRGRFELGDLRDLCQQSDEAWTVVFASFNVIDVLDDDERSRTLDEIARMLAPDGLLIFSSHNRAAAVEGPLRLHRSGPLHLAAELARMPRRLRNHRRLRRFECERSDYAIRNDGALDYSLLHYYIDRDESERQLRAHGFELLECLDLDGAQVGPGASVSDCPELHYVARRVR